MATIYSSIRRTFWHVLALLGFFAAAANAQDRCGTLADALKFGADEVEVTSMRDEARRLYRFACGEQSTTTDQRSSSSINASYNVFSAGASNNSRSIDEYREKHCSLEEDDVVSVVANSFRQRRVNPEVVRGWSACVSDQTGLSLDPRFDPNQKIASFSITYDARRFSTIPILRGISSTIFECERAGTGEAIGVGGDPIEISPTEALVIRCDRGSDPGDIEGRLITVYRDGSLILDLTTGQHRIDFAARREGPALEALEEFAELQAELNALSRRVAELAASQELSAGYSVRFFNVDNVMSLVVNGRTVLECNIRRPHSCYLTREEFGEHLREGENDVAVELHNLGGQAAYGYEIREHGALIYAKSCGNVSDPVRTCEESSIDGRRGTERLLDFVISVQR